MSGYDRRIVDDELNELLPYLPAIALDGPKGVGKTTTAAQRCATRFDLDDERTLEVLRADASRMTAGPDPTLIDEWQRFPASWDIVRRAVDHDPTPNRFLLTGSTSLSNPQTHSGAARIVSVRMRPQTLVERGVESPTVSLKELLTGSRKPITGRTGVTLTDYVDAIVASGFPGLQATSGRARRAQLSAYLHHIIDRDFSEAGYDVRNPAALQRWLTAYAAATSTTTSYDKIRHFAAGDKGSAIAKTTANAYRDTLERLWLLDPVPAWSSATNHVSRLSLTPKHHLADPALAAQLLGVSADALIKAESGGPAIVRHGTLVAALFESLVALNLRVYAQASEARVHHLRTWSGDHEVDFVIVKPDQRFVAIEAKLKDTIHDSDLTHLRWLAQKFGSDLCDSVVVTTGREAYRRSDGIAVVPAALLGV
jgi:predicted AAA+ superfamily ATPase